MTTWAFAPLNSFKGKGIRVAVERSASVDGLEERSEELLNC